MDTLSHAHKEKITRWNLCQLPQKGLRLITPFRDPIARSPRCEPANGLSKTRNSLFCKCNYLTQADKTTCVSPSSALAGLRCVLYEGMSRKKISPISLERRALLCLCSTSKTGDLSLSVNYRIHRDSHADSAFWTVNRQPGNNAPKVADR